MKTRANPGPLFVAPSGRMTKAEAMAAFARREGADGFNEHPDGSCTIGGYSRRYRLTLVRTAAGWVWAVFPDGEEFRP